MSEKRDWEYFKLQYDPNPSGRFRDISQGYWVAYAEPGYDGDGLTPLDAMANLVIAMSKALVEERNPEPE